MTWFKVDDTFAFHTKAVAAGNAAIGLWVRAGAWSAQQLTDGKIPTAVAASLGTSQQAQRLVAVGLWESRPDGYAFHQWSTDGRQPTRAEVESRRQREREKKAEQRRGSGGRYEPSPPSSPGDKGGTPAGSPTVPSRPGPTRPGPTPHGVGRSARETALPESWQPTTEHASRAVEAGLDLSREATKFRAHAEEKGRTAKNWNAAFTRWLINAADYAQRDRRAVNGRPTTDDRVREGMALAQRLAQDEYPDTLQIGD